MNTDFVYFISDIHLGLDTDENLSIDREKKLANWLIEISENASSVYFLGDIFDYWFEFKNETPPQYPVFYQALKTLKSKGVAIIFFTGNHDMWMKNYLPDQFGIELYTEPQIKNILGKQFYLAHGDGLGKGDYGYKILKTVMCNPISMYLYSLIPSKIGFGLMRFMSQKSRERHGDDFQGFPKERLINFCKQHAQSSSINFYIMGHRHLMIDYKLSPEGSRFINLGDWLQFDSYAVYDGHTLTLKSLSDGDHNIIS